MELKPKMDIDSWCFFCKNGQLTTLMTKTNVSLSEHGPFTLKELLFHWANEVLNHPICGVFPLNLQPNWRIRDSQFRHSVRFIFVKQRVLPADELTGAPANRPVADTRSDSNPSTEPCHHLEGYHPHRATTGGWGPSCGWLSIPWIPQAVERIEVPVP